MSNQRIQEIIFEINTKRLREKQAERNCLIRQASLQTETIVDQHVDDSSTESITSGIQRSCKRSCEGSCKRSCEQIKTQQRAKSRKRDGKQLNWKKWTKVEQKLMCKLIGIYGSDFAFLQTQFPYKTRKQLKKKYQEIHKSQRCVQEIDSIESYLMRQKRKAHFDTEIMQIPPIIHISKSIPIPKEICIIKNDGNDMFQESSSQ